MSKQKEQVMSADPSEHYEQSPREARRRGSGLRSRRRPAERAQAHRLRRLGTACGRAQRHVPGPASVNGERRSFALLRPANGEAAAQEAIRDAILEAYSRLEAAS